MALTRQKQGKQQTLSESAILPVTVFAEECQNLTDKTEGADLVGKQGFYEEFTCPCAVCTSQDEAP